MLIIQLSHICAIFPISELLITCQMHDLIVAKVLSVAIYITSFHMYLLTAHVKNL